MFEKISINIADQWVDTTIGNIFEAAVFYREVELVTPFSRLSNLLRGQPDRIEPLIWLVENGHLSISLEQFPAGELARELYLLEDPFSRSFKTALLSKGRTLTCPPIVDVMGDEYKKISMYPRILAEDVWLGEALGNAERHRLVDKLVDGIHLPVVDRAYAREKLLALQRLLDAPGGELLQQITDYHGALDRAGNRRTAVVLDEISEVEGISLRHVGGQIASGSLLNYISFADFLLRNRSHPSLDDLFTSDRFNDLMRYLYAREVDLLGGRSDVDVFQNAVLRTTPIRTLIDSGELPLSEVMKVIETKEDFISEVISKPPDLSLTEWYVQSRDSGFRSKNLGWKLVRFGIFSALGVAIGVALAGPPGAAAGVVVGALDSFAVDPLVAKGGPKTFVDNLKDIVGRVNT